MSPSSFVPAPANTISTPRRRAASSSAIAMPGYRCPPVPPPATTIVSDATSGDARLRRMLRDVQQHPEGAQADDQARAAVGQERQRDPLRRHQTQRYRHVHHRLRDQPDRNPHPEVITTAVRGAHGRHDAAPEQHPERRNHRRGSDQPQLLRDHREDEIGVRLRQEEQLLAALADALAVQAAAGHCQDRLAHLEAGPQRVVLRVQERQDAANAVRRLYDHHGDRQGAGAAAEHEVAPAQPGEEQEDDRQQDVDRRRAEVGLQVDQKRELADHDRARDDRADDVVDLGLLARHEIREKQDERQLADLGRLDLQRPQDDPAVHLVRAVRGQGDDQEHGAREDAEVDERPLQEAAVVHVHRRDHAADADGGRDRLLHQEQMRVPEALQGDDRRGAVDHHQTEQRQADPHPEERLVEGQLARHQDPGGRRRTRRRKSSPRSSNPEYRSNEAQAGARSTTPPSAAAARAASTASSMSATFVVGTTAPICAAITSRACPMSTRCVTRRLMSGTSCVKSPPLSLPPRMSTTPPGKLSRDLIVALTFVALESLYQVTPPMERTDSRRCGRPRKLARARSARGSGTPHRSVISRAAMTFSMLCAPNSGIEARGIARMSRPSLRTTIRSPFRQAPSSTVAARLNGWTCAVRSFDSLQTSASSRFRMAWSALPWFLKMRDLAW